MSKVYKGYELIKEIAEGNIKEDTKFREMEENKHYIVKDRKLWQQLDTGIYDSKLENLPITYGIFELIEEDTIDNIEECNINISCQELDHNLRDMQSYINNVIVEAVKQLNRELKEYKNK